MGVYLEQIEQHNGGRKAGVRKWAKKQRNRFLRRFKINQTPLTKLRRGWEY